MGDAGREILDFTSIIRSTLDIFQVNSWREGTCQTLFGDIMKELEKLKIPT